MSSRKDFILGVVFLTISLILFIFSFGIKSMTNVAIGPEFFPRLISILTAICSLVLIYDSYKKLKSDRECTKDVVRDKSLSLNLNAEVIKVFLLMLIYSILLKPVGYLIMTAAYLLIHFLLVSDKESRKIPLFLIISVVVSVGTYYAFRDIFGVILPAGILG